VSSHSTVAASSTTVSTASVSNARTIAIPSPVSTPAPACVLEVTSYSDEPTSPVSPSSPAIRCIHNACSFSATSDLEISAHLQESCQYEHLVRRIDQLVGLVGEKDEQILRLTEQLQILRRSSNNQNPAANPEERPSDDKDAAAVVAEFAEAVRQVGKEVFKTISREGEQLVSDAKANLLQARNKVRGSGSQALQASLQTLSNLKLAIATMSKKAQREVAAKLDELAQAAAQLPSEIREEFKALRQSIENSVSNQNQPQPSAESSSSVVSEDKSDLSDLPVLVVPEPAPVAEEVVDEDLKKAMALSKEAFDLEQSRSQSEEEAMRIAILQSISVTPQ